VSIHADLTPPSPPLLLLRHRTAESAARSAVKLEEMTRLLERLAMDKVSEGDDAGARQVLQVQTWSHMSAGNGFTARYAGSNCLQDAEVDMLGCVAKVLGIFLSFVCHGWCQAGRKPRGCWSAWQWTRLLTVTMHVLRQQVCSAFVSAPSRSVL
jgi:hypothetical protein